MISFWCDLCGTPGCAQAPGVAQCTTCGRVALVEGPAGASPAPDRHGAASRDPFAPEDPTLLLEDEIVEPAPRLATLWVRPGGEDTQEQVAMPVRARRPLLRKMIAIAAGTAVAAGGAMAIRASWIGDDRDDGSVAVSSAPEPVAPAPPSPPRAPARLASRPRHEAPAPAEDAFAPRIAALRNPTPADGRCVPRALRLRRDLAARLPEAVTVRFPVAASGAVGRVEVLRPATDDDVARAIEDAIRSCTFVPGADDDGRPATLPVVMRIRFARD